MVWRGGFVISTISSDGDKIRPVETEKARENYQFNERLESLLKHYDDPSGSAYTISSNNYLAIPYPTGLNGNKVVSISLLDFGTVSGPITILPYGSTGSSWYMLGANGTSITAARFRYWYI